MIGVDEEHKALLGARLATVNGKPIASIRNELLSFAGGTQAHCELIAADVLASPAQLHAIGLSDQFDRASYELVTQQGDTKRQVLVVAVTNQARGQWLQLPSLDRAPWAFQAPSKPFRYNDAKAIDALIVQLRQTFDAADQKLADFLNEAEQQRAALGRRNVVLDMRFNNGGNFYLARDFMRRWPERVPGNFYVLTSRRTFSAAIASIAYLEQAAPERVFIIGEPVGDRLNFFSDGLPIRLPHSGRYFLTAVLRMDYETAAANTTIAARRSRSPVNPSRKRR